MKTGGGSLPATAAVRRQARRAAADAAVSQAQAAEARAQMEAARRELQAALRAHAQAERSRITEDEAVGQLLGLMLWLRDQGFTDHGGAVRIADQRIGGCFRFG